MNSVKASVSMLIKNGKDLSVRTIRTISVGCTLPKCTKFDVNNAYDLWRPVLKRAVEFNNAAKIAFEERGYVVQTTRVLSNPFEEYMPPEKEVECAKIVDRIMVELGASLMNIGPARSLKSIEKISEMLKETKSVYCSIEIPSPYENEDAVKISDAAAVATLDVSKGGVEQSFKLCSSL